MSLPLEIHQAADRGDLGTVRQFVESSPDCVNEAFGGTNLLLCAISSCRETDYADSAQLVQYLMSRGADVECRGMISSALECACSYYHTEAVALLLHAGANVHRIDELGSAVCIPLFIHSDHFAIGTVAQMSDRIFECLRLLLRAGLALDVLHKGTTTRLEQIIGEYMHLYEPARLVRSLDLVRAVRASLYTSASPRLSLWRQYVLAPSVAVLRLRSLAARGRARVRGVVSGPTPRHIAWLLAPRTPPEIVWNVLAYWNPCHE